MKERTLIYTVEITDVFGDRKEGCEFEETYLADLIEDKASAEEHIKAALACDDVHVKDVKVFEREV